MVPQKSRFKSQDKYGLKKCKSYEVSELEK